MITKSTPILLLLMCFIMRATDPLQVSVQSTGYQKTPLLIALINADMELGDMALQLKKDFEYSQQFNVDIKPFPSIMSKNDIKDLTKQGYQLALFLNYAEGQAIEWRLYNTHQAHMIKGKKYAKRGNVSRVWAHAIADVLWPVMTSKPGFFSTKIAYCQEVPLKNGRHHKHVYLADYDGSHAQPLITSPTISVAPRWNKDKENPLLFYSECTSSNVRLMASDMKKRHKIVSNFDGLNMQPAFSADGKKVVYCASRGDGCCQLYCYQKNGFKRLTRNSGNNISPVFSAKSDKLFFCSDFQMGTPQIYSYDLTTDSLEKLTENGYCASPTFCGATNMLAYTKLVKGVSQIFTYDIEKKVHKQLTFDGSSKEECSWSECGSYLIHSVQEGSHSRIAHYNVITGHRTYLTPPDVHCSYPAWSGIYNEFPQVA